MKPIMLETPLTKDKLKNLKAGDEVLLSGTIFTARDAAHARLAALIRKGGKVPLNLKDACIYYAGPTPGRGKRSIGSCGPTTSSRMDAFTPGLLRLGVSAIIGKGDRSDEVRKAIRKHGCVYFLAVGGIGALLATKIRSARQVLYAELGPEAIHKLDVKGFPLTVGIDPKGRNIYEKAGWKKQR